MPGQPDAFQSKDLELAFFECAANYEVLRYVDVVSTRMCKDDYSGNKDGFYFECSRQLENLLFERNDNAIDIALARIASPSMLSEIFKRHQSRNPLQPYEVGVSKENFSSTWDHYKALQEKEECLDYYDRLVLSALSNRVSQSTWLGMESWLSAVWEWLLVFGRSVQFDALFSNPDCPRKLVDKVLERDFSCSFDRRELALLSSALGCKLISTPPSDDHDYDSATHKTIGLFWKFVKSVDPTDVKGIVALGHNKDNFPEFEIRDEVFGLPKFDEPGYEHKANAQKAFEQLVRQFALTDEERQDKRGLYFKKLDVCQGIAKSYINTFWYDQSAKSYAIEHENDGVRLGYYEAGRFGNKDVDGCKNYLSRDGFSFCRAALRNPAFFNRRDNAQLVQWFLRTIYSGLQKEHFKDDYDGGPILEWYLKEAKKYFERLPEIYIDPKQAERIAVDEEEIVEPPKKSFWR